MEQRIRALCIEVQNTHDSDRIEQIGDKLRTAIHVHVEHLRNEVAALATARQRTLPVLEAREKASRSSFTRVLVSLVGWGYTAGRGGALEP